MKQLLTVLIAAMFAAVSVGAIARIRQDRRQERDEVGEEGATAAQKKRRSA